MLLGLTIRFTDCVVKGIRVYERFHIWVDIGRVSVLLTEQEVKQIICDMRTYYSQPYRSLFYSLRNTPCPDLNNL
jgi:hypothetical protein